MSSAHRAPLASPPAWGSRPLNGGALAANGEAHSPHPRLDELRRSWRVLLACCLGASIGAAAFPLFLVPVIGLRLEQAFGWSRLETSSLTSIAFIGGALGVPVVGWLNDRWSVRWPAIGSLAIIGGLLLLASGAPSQIGWWRAGAFALMFGGAGTLSASFCKIICLYFSSMRGLALGLTIGSVSLVGALGLPWINLAIDRVGLDQFLLRAGLFYFLFAIPLMFFVLPEARRPQASCSVSAAVRRRALRGPLWLLGTAGFLLSIVTGTTAHLAAIAADGGQVSPALVGSVFAGGVMISRPLAGWLIDRVDARLVGATVAGLASAGLLLVGLLGDQAVIPAALLLAAAIGTEFDVVAFLASHYVDPALFGRAFGWMYAGMLAAAAAGPVFIALLLDASGSYGIPFLITAVLAGSAAIIIARLPVYPAVWRVP